MHGDSAGYIHVLLRDCYGLYICGLYRYGLYSYGTCAAMYGDSAGYIHLTRGSGTSRLVTLDRAVAVSKRRSALSHRTITYTVTA